MSTYELAIEFDSQGLKTINAAGQLVTIVKSVNGGRPVAWVAFQPMQHNLVTWTETYSVYASTTQIQDGAQIFTQSTAPAVGGNTYQLVGGQFGAGRPGLAAAQYGVSNQDPNFVVNGVEMVTSGLYQGAVVNGEPTASPLNAVAIPYNDTGKFVPIERVQVFTSSYQNNGLVISEVSSNALAIDFTEQLTRAIHYSDTTNQFAEGGL